MDLLKSNLSYNTQLLSWWTQAKFRSLDWKEDLNTVIYEEANNLQVSSTTYSATSWSQDVVPLKVIKILSKLYKLQLSYLG